MIRRELGAFFAALGYFTRLPVPAWVGYSPDGLARAARYLPLALPEGVRRYSRWPSCSAWSPPSP